MFNNKEYHQILRQLPEGIALVAVSKFHPAHDILSAYEAGQRIFGESRPQELVAKYNELPYDIQWHMIGSLQRNKIKYIAPFVALIHSVDSLSLAEAIDKEGRKIARRIPVLLQVHVAREQTKHGFSSEELLSLFEEHAFQALEYIEIKGLMTMATYTDDNSIVEAEFAQAKELFETIKSKYLPELDTLSMGMSGDYSLAIAQGSTMVRIGSALFGDRY